jgi:Transposase DDE domain
MVRLTCLPKQVVNWLQVLRPMFRHRHHLVFCWLLVCQAIYQDKATVTGLARLAPCHIAEWHLRRLLTAAYWNTRILLWWFADQAIAALPPPNDGVCYLVVDSTLKDKTGQKHPLAKKGRLNEYAPYIFGLHIVVMMLQWGNYRVPVDFEIVRRKDDPHYRSENRLFRWMLVRFRRPAWAEMVVVVADAAFASRANLQLIQRRGYCFVMALARTWHFENGHTLKDLVTHLPTYHYRRCWVPLEEPSRRRTYWTFTKQGRLRHIGDVTMILSKKRRNDGPKQTKILVTNLLEVTARQVVDVYRRRWSVEISQPHYGSREHLSLAAA